MRFSSVVYNLSSEKKRIREAPGKTVHSKILLNLVLVLFQNVRKVLNETGYHSGKGEMFWGHSQTKHFFSDRHGWVFYS